MTTTSVPGTGRASPPDAPATPAISGKVVAQGQSLVRGRAATAAVMCAVALLCAPAALAVMFTVHFAPYDDEGYYLYSVQAFLSHNGVYSHVVTAYGPAYHEIMALPFVLSGLPLTHDAARLVTVVAWVVGTVLASALVKRLTGSVVASAAAAPLAFLALCTLSNEPLQPASVIVPASALLVWSGSTRSPSRLSGLAAGCALAVVGLCKLNIGLFLVEALLVSWCLLNRPPKRSMVAAAGVLTVVTLAGLAFGTGATGPSLAVTATAGSLLLAILLAAPKGAKDGAEALPIVPVLAGAAVTAVVSVVAALAWGESLSPMVRSLVGTSVGIAARANLPLAHSAVLLLLALLAAAAVAAARKPRDVALLRVGGFALAVAGALVVGRTVQTGGTAPSAFCIVGLVSAPIVLLPPRHDPEAAVPHGRVLLAAVTVFESLQVLPVAGSQLGFAAYLASVCGAICLADLVRDAPRPQYGQWLASALAAALVVTGPVGDAVAVWAKYRDAPPVALAGSTAVHLKREQVAPLEQVVSAVRSSGCRALITYPGMMSFYSWTGLAAPPGVRLADATVWSMPPYSSALLEALEGQGGICLIENVPDWFFWSVTVGLGPGKPALALYFKSHFRLKGTFGAYTLWAEPSVAN
ncbi:MAG TPA: hypothetical protein VL984_06295 [Acidimicrobiales bacterium]|nr:hypothetical protein [Acidimicrobiales bacterium]